MITFIVYLFVFLKNCIYGISVFFTGKLSNNVDFLDILALRFLLTFVVFYILKALKIVKINIGYKDYIGKTNRSKYMKSLFLAGLFEPVLYMLFETIGITMTTNITAAVILSLMPVASCIAESLILKEHTTFMEKVFFLIGILGVVYIAVNTDVSGSKDSVLGIMFIVLAVITASLFSVYSRKSAKKFTAMERTYFASFLGMIVFNSINIVRHLYVGDILSYFNPYFNFDNIIGFVYLSVISTILAAGMNNYALGKVQASTVSAFSGVSTFVTIMAGIFFGGEVLHTFQVIGITLILIRIIGVSYISIKKNSSGKNKEISETTCQS